MKKREFSEETKNKILICAANILSMHGEVAGSGICQDWPVDVDKETLELRTEMELEILKAVKNSVEKFTSASGLSINNVSVDVSEITRVNDKKRRFKPTNVELSIDM